MARSNRRSTAATAARIALASLLLLALSYFPASALTIDFYSGTDSAGSGVDISVIEASPVNLIYYFGFGGDRYCDGALVPGALFGGNIDGTILYPVIDGRATFSELRPDFFIQADIRFHDKGLVTGTALFKQAIYTGTNFPPADGDAAACTTKRLAFTAKYTGSTTLDEKPAARLR